MIRSMYDTDHPERARIASYIRCNCRGKSLHSDSNQLADVIRYEVDKIGAFFFFLFRTGCYGSRAREAQGIFRKWSHVHEATYMDEWKKWSKDVNAQSDH